MNLLADVENMKLRLPLKVAESRRIAKTFRKRVAVNLQFGYLYMHRTAE